MSIGLRLWLGTLALGAAACGSRVEKYIIQGSGTTGRAATQAEAGSRSDSERVDPDTGIIAYNGYELTEPGCSTGAHWFWSRVEYCRALADDDRNNGCAVDRRAAMLASNCAEEDYLYFGQPAHGLGYSVGDATCTAFINGLESKAEGCAMLADDVRNNFCDAAGRKRYRDELWCVEE
jgi:hypothetical protein